MIYLRSANRADFEALEAIICSNLGLPNQYGTTGFLYIEQAVNDGKYFTCKPTGWPGNNNENFTAEQILNGTDLSAFTEEEYDPAWKPPRDLVGD